MINFGKWAFDNRKLVWFLVVLLLAGGIFYAFSMSKLEDPEVKVKMAIVVATYPGASAHETELQVTEPIERSIRTMGEVENIQSWSYNDYAIIQVELKSTVKDEDIEQNWDLLRRKVSDIQPSLPSGTSLNVQDDFGLVYGMLYALSSDGATEEEMSDYARLIQRELTNIEGVARVNIYGERPKCINIRLSSEQMATLGVSPAEIISTLK